jgi:hypothetical protein
LCLVVLKALKREGREQEEISGRGSRGKKEKARVKESDALKRAVLQTREVEETWILRERSVVWES